MRHLYLDEAGTSNEPFTVVAGFMLHVDDQYQDVVDFLDSMARELFGDRLSPEFVFHAKDLWHGSGFFPREEWPRERRMEILVKIAGLPVQLNAPVIYAAVSRDEISQEKFGKEAVRIRHQSAFQQALLEAEKILADRYPDERAFAIVEDHATHRKHLQRIFGLMYDKDTIFDLKQIGIEHPYQRLVETPLFQPKNGTSPVQVADVCAFLIRRRLEGCPHAREITETLTPQLRDGWKTQFIRWS